MAKQRDSVHVKAQKEGKVRDQYTCQICGSTENVEGHHLFDYAFSGAADPDNIITLCHRCHRAVHNGLIDLYVF